MHRPQVNASAVTHRLSGHMSDFLHRTADATVHLGVITDPVIRNYGGSLVTGPREQQDGELH